MTPVPAWRIAWYHPRHGHWHLALYEYWDREAAAAVAALLVEHYGMTRVELIPATGWTTDHGVG